MKSLLDLDHPLDIPDDFNIAEACLSSRYKSDSFSPEQIALIVDQDQSFESLTYAELDLKSNQLANALAQSGCEKSDRVMICLPNCIEFPIAFFGILKLGAIATPSSMLLSGDELNYLASDSGAKTLITTPSHWNKLSDFLNATSHSSKLQLEMVILVSAQEVITYESDVIRLYNWQELIDSSSNNFQLFKTKANDPAYLVYTSGTTGYPKGVLHAHRALFGRIPAAQSWFDYSNTQTDRILHSGKFNWTYVLGTAMMDPLLLGKSVVVYEGITQADTWTKLIAKHACTIFIGVPTLYRQIIQKTTTSKQDVPSLRYCMCAGEHLSAELYEQWQERFGLAIYEAIGMSECSYYLSQHPTRKVKPGSAGFPQKGHHIYLLDEKFEPVADNQEGMLCIGLGDPGLFIEYWKQHDTTQSSRQHGYFLTGDYAYRDSEGYFWFLGRRDDLINSFGYRISPHEIERVLKTHPNIADCVALEESIGKDKALVVACLILHNAATYDEAALFAFANDHLASYKQPKKYYVMESFPKTANGKVLRKQLRMTILNKNIH